MPGRFIQRSHRSGFTRTTQGDWWWNKTNRKEILFKQERLQGAPELIKLPPFLGGVKLDPSRCPWFWHRFGLDQISECGMNKEIHTIIHWNRYLQPQQRRIRPPGPACRNWAVRKPVGSWRLFAGLLTSGWVDLEGSGCSVKPQRSTKQLSRSSSTNKQPTKLSYICCDKQVSHPKCGLPSLDTINPHREKLDITEDQNIQNEGKPTHRTTGLDSEAEKQSSW